MRSSVLMFFLLLSILIQDVQGMRLRKGTSVSADRQHSIHGQLLPGKKSNGGVQEGVVCKSKKCIPGRSTKLTVLHISSTTTNSEHHENDEVKDETNQKIGRKEENIAVNLSSDGQKGQPSTEPYPNTIDIAGMDYSLQGRRRPPIHN